KLILSDQTQMLIAVGHLVIKYILDPSLLFEISNRFEEAVLTEMHLITLTIVLSAITPARLKTSVLRATTFMQSGSIANITQNIGDGLNFDTPTNLHRCSPQKRFLRDPHSARDYICQLCAPLYRFYLLPLFSSRLLTTYPSRSYPCKWLVWASNG